MVPEKNTLFILGAGRSGTKILRDCLGAAQDVSAIPYDIGYVWRCGNEACSHDELSAENVKSKDRIFIKQVLHKLACKAYGNDQFQIIVEKSVPNCLRPALLKAIFPNAKFIHLVRDGRNVVESSMRNWLDPSDKGYFFDKLRYFPLRMYPYAFWYVRNFVKKLFSPSRYSLWGPRYDGMVDDVEKFPLIEVCAKQWRACVSICDEQLSRMPDSDYMEVKYEAFVSDYKVVEKVCNFAGIVDCQGVEKYYLENVRPENQLANKRKLTATQLADVERIITKELVRHNYEVQ